MNWETVVVGLAGPVVAMLLARRKDARDNRAVEASARLQVVLLDERLKRVPEEIQHSIDESRGKLIEQLQNGLGQRIIRPVMDRLDGIERRLDRANL